MSRYSGWADASLTKQLQASIKVAKANKYGAKRVLLDGYTFDSKREAKRFTELKLMKQAGFIRDLVIHPSFRIDYKGVDICRVELDFVYYIPSGPNMRPEDCGFRYEDVKSSATDTPLSRLKRKLVEAFYPGIKVEVIK